MNLSSRRAPRFESLTRLLIPIAEVVFVMSTPTPKTTPRHRRKQAFLQSVGRRRKKECRGVRVMLEGVPT